MSEPNGSEREARLNRLDREHEQFRRDLQQLLTAQVIQKDQIDQLLKTIEAEGQERREADARLRENDAALDKRVADLVSSIADLIRRIPPENLRSA